MKPETTLRVNVRSGFCIKTGLNSVFARLPCTIFRNYLINTSEIQYWPDLLTLYHLIFLPLRAITKTKEQVHC
jgi:hypothetical protein